MVAGEAGPWHHREPKAERFPVDLAQLLSPRHLGYALLYNETQPTAGSCMSIPSMRGFSALGRPLAASRGLGSSPSSAG